VKPARDVMTAVVQHGCSPNAIEVAERPMALPGSGQRQTKVGASTINPMDWRLATSSPYSIRRPVGQIAVGIATHRDAEPMQGAASAGARS